MANRTDRDLNINLLAKDATKAGTASAADNFNKLSDSVTKADRSAGKLSDTAAKQRRNLDKLSDTALVVGAGLVAAFGAAVVSAARFDKQMSEVRAVAGASARDLDALRAAAVRAGKDTSFSATQAAQAEAELAKAGVSTSDILGGALSGSLALAAAGSLDLATAAEISAAAMNTFGLSGRDVGHIADVFAAAANKSAAGVDDLGQGLQQVGLVAAQAGLSLEETTALLAAFADRGLKGSDAGTSLKTALQKLTAPTTEAKSTMDALGIAVYDSNGKVKDAAALASDLQHAMAALSDEQRNAALNTIFGTDAIRAANVLIKLGKNGVDDYVRAVDDMGAAGDVAATKMDNLAGDVERLKGSLESLAIGSAGASTGGLRMLVQSGDALVQNLSALPSWFQQGATGAGLLAGATLLAGGAYGKLMGKVDDATAALARHGTISTGTANKLNLLAGMAGKAAGAFIAFEVIGAIVDGAVRRDINPQIDAATKGLEGWREGMNLSGEAAKLFGDDLGEAAHALNVLGGTDWQHRFTRWVEPFPGISGDIANLRIEANALDQALVELANRGETDQAMRILAKVAQDAGISFDEALAVTNLFRGKLEVLGGPTKAAAGALGGLNGELTAMETKLKGINTQWDILHGKQLAETDALLGAAEAAQNVAEVFAEGGKSIDGHSVAALENKKALEDSAKAAKDAALAMADRTGDWGAAMALMDEMKAKTIANTGAIGKEREAVQGLANDLFNLPITTQLSIKLRLDDSGLTKLGGSIGKLHGWEGSMMDSGFALAAPMDVPPMFSADGTAPRFAVGGDGAGVGHFTIDGGTTTVNVNLDGRPLRQYVDTTVSQAVRQLRRAQKVGSRD